MRSLQIFRFQIVYDLCGRQTETSHGNESLSLSFFNISFALLFSGLVRIGDAKLRKVSKKIQNIFDADLIAKIGILMETLKNFRQKMGFGRAISAPQIGINQRFLAIKLEKEPFIMINPEINKKSKRTLTYWDDCMSFPWLMVKVKRSQSISLAYENMAGEKIEWKDLDFPTSELLQHEIDHLDGILAIDRALDIDSIVCREVFLKT